jgi:hypothetical protein
MIKGAQEARIKSTTISLVEDHPDDDALTVYALKKNRIGKKNFVIRDGAEVLDFLFCTNKYAERYPDALPQLYLIGLSGPFHTEEPLIGYQVTKDGWAGGVATPPRR